MATKKTAPKKPVAKKTTAKTTAKKAVVTKSPKKKATAVERTQSFKVSRPDTPFLTLAITRQTLYWGIIAFAVLALGLWIIMLQIKINDIYDTIEANNIETSIQMKSE